MSVKTDVKKIIYTQVALGLCIVIKNKFGHHRIGDRNQIWSAIRLATKFSTFLSLNWVAENFQLSYMAIEFFGYAPKNNLWAAWKNSSNQYWPLIQQLKIFLSLPQKNSISAQFFSTMFENFDCQQEQLKIFSHQTRKVNNFDTDCGDHLD